MPIPQVKSESFPKTAKERVFTVMREWIIDGTLKPGEKIFDKEIADYFAVSRTPVREAFQMLEEQKLIVIAPGKETRVSEVDPVAVRQSYELLAELDAKAVEYAISQMTEEAYTILKDSTARLKKAIKSGDAKAASEADEQFHAAIRELSGNEFLARFCSTLATHIARVERHFFSKQDITEMLPASVGEHERIIDGMLAGDSKAAGSAMAENWLNTIPWIEKYL